MPFIALKSIPLFRRFLRAKRTNAPFGRLLSVDTPEVITAANGRKKGFDTS
ncbi:MAG: hypothetical protein ACLFM0_06560 [Spirochaetales bacterium]